MTDPKFLKTVKKVQDDSDTAFVNAIKKRKEKEQRIFKDALLFATSEATDGADNEFIQSCQKQFDQKGYLTSKQVEALYKFDSRAEQYFYDRDGDEGLDELDFRADSD